MLKTIRALSHHGGITREGSKWIRWALTQAVHVHLKYDTNLTRFYRRLAAKKPSQVAVMATARKMLKIVYWMLRNNEPYHPGPSGSCTPCIMTLENM